eukprot:TRINITY_DN12722_c0_g5_i1.p1 TRINITY_DN12722_c0_g5~~TRINITY_DN12722_c0_g5_i1.p1  ORF type:complete len:949 (+),score=150.91 TRINITY_DN12722_c0_g5_i1:118-2964(+)
MTSRGGHVPLQAHSLSATRPTGAPPPLRARVGGGVGNLPTSTGADAEGFFGTTGTRTPQTGSGRTQQSNTSTSDAALSSAAAAGSSANATVGLQLASAAPQRRRQQQPSHPPLPGAPQSLRQVMGTGQVAETQGTRPPEVAARNESQRDPATQRSFLDSRGEVGRVTRGTARATIRARPLVASGQGSSSGGNASGAPTNDSSPQGVASSFIDSYQHQATDSRTAVGMGRHGHPSTGVPRAARNHADVSVQRESDNGASSNSSVAGSRQTSGGNGLDFVRVSDSDIASAAYGIQPTPPLPPQLPDGRRISPVGISQGRVATSDQTERSGGYPSSAGTPPTAPSAGAALPRGVTLRRGSGSGDISAALRRVGTGTAPIAMAASAPRSVVGGGSGTSESAAQRFLGVYRGGAVTIATGGDVASANSRGGGNGGMHRNADRFVAATPSADVSSSFVPNNSGSEGATSASVQGVGVGRFNLSDRDRQPHRNLRVSRTSPSQGTTASTTPPHGHAASAASGSVPHGGLGYGERQSQPTASSLPAWFGSGAAASAAPSGATRIAEMAVGVQEASPRPPLPRATAPFASLRSRQPSASEELEQGEKDKRLVELLSLASLRGFGDLDPEAAAQELEDVDWDVAQAFAHLYGSQDPGTTNQHSPADPRHAPLATYEQSGDNSMLELDHLRLQEEEWKRTFAAEEAAHTGRANVPAEFEVTASRARRAAARASATAAAVAAGHSEEVGRSALQGSHFPVSGRDFINVEDRFRQLFPNANALAGRRVVGRTSSDEGSERDEGGDEEAGWEGEEEEDEEDFEDTRAELAARLFSAEAAGFILGGDDIRLQTAAALVNSMLRMQDEADLQDAIQRSTEEAYSGGFSVPPADDAMLMDATATSEYAGPTKGDASNQCAVCLSNYERGDHLRKLQCGHDFHLACVDQWLAQSGQCPVCKHRIGT